MNPQLILGLILTLLPIFELRAGLPIVIEYALKNGLPIIPFFILVLLLNISIIFIELAFLDFLHTRLLKFNFYKNSFNKILEKTKKKSQKIEKRMNKLGYLALMLFVAVPLPGSGAWTGTLISWVMGLKRKYSIIAISLGVVIAGLILLFLSLRLFG